MKTILNLQTGRIQEVSDSVAETLVRTNKFSYVSGKPEVDQYNWIDVESSTIHSIKYNKATKTLYIKFGQPVVSSMYEYYNVPEKIYTEFLNADSKGSYCYHNIAYSFKYKRIS